MPSPSETEVRPASRLPSKQPPVTSLEPARSVAQRLGRSVRTIERWVKAGILPPPMQVRGRNLHRAGVMPTADDARKATASEAVAERAKHDEVTGDHA